MLDQSKFAIIVFACFIFFFQPYLGWFYLETTLGCECVCVCVCDSVEGGKGEKRLALPNVCHTDATVMKNGTVITYLKNNQKT